MQPQQQQSHAESVYLALFKALDAQGVWPRELGEEGTTSARTAARSADSWSHFLKSASTSAPSQNVGVGALCALATSARAPKQPVSVGNSASNASSAAVQNNTAARVRRRLTLAAVDSVELAHYSDARRDLLYEPDVGLLRGDCGGAAPPFDDAQREETAHLRARAPFFALFGSSSTTAQPTESPSVGLRAPRKRPRRSAPDARFASAHDTLLTPFATEPDVEALQETALAILAPPPYTPGAADYAAQTVDEIVGSALPPSPLELDTPAESSDDMEQYELWLGDAEHDPAAADVVGDDVVNDDLLLPIFPDDAEYTVTLSHAKSRLVKLEQRKTFTEMLGNDNPILNSIMSTRRIIALRKTAIAAREAIVARSTAAALAAAPVSSSAEIASGAPAVSGVPAASAAPSGSTSTNVSIKTEPSLLMNESTRSKQTIIAKAPRRPPAAVAAIAPHVMEGNTEKVIPLVIENEPSEVESGIRNKSLASVSTALMLEQAGFTHTSGRALDVLTDAMGRMIRDIGVRLSNARERIGEYAQENGPSRTDMLLEAARIVTSQGATRGSASALQAYLNYDLVRLGNEQTAAEKRLSAVCAHYGADPIATVRAINAPIPRAPASAASATAPSRARAPDVFHALNDASWTFGYLPRGAHLNVLGGTPTPPRTLGCSAIGCPEPANVPHSPDAAQDLACMNTSP